MLPGVFGWKDVFAGRPKLAAWWAALQKDPAAVRVSGGAGPGQPQPQRVAAHACARARTQPQARARKRACASAHWQRPARVPQVIDEVKGGLKGWVDKDRCAPGQLLFTLKYNMPSVQVPQCHCYLRGQSLMCCCNH